MATTFDVFFYQRLPSLPRFNLMSLFNNVIKVTVAGGVVIGSAVAYARLSDEQRQTIKQGVTKIRRKVADFIAPNDGAYDLPKEVQEELEALLNDKE